MCVRACVLVCMFARPSVCGCGRVRACARASLGEEGRGGRGGEGTCGRVTQKPRIVSRHALRFSESLRRRRRRRRKFRTGEIGLWGRGWGAGGRGSRGGLSMVRICVRGARGGGGCETRRTPAFDRGSHSSHQTPARPTPPRPKPSPAGPRPCGRAGPFRAGARLWGPWSGSQRGASPVSSLPSALNTARLRICGRGRASLPPRTQVRAYLPATSLGTGRLAPCFVSRSGVG